MRNSIFILIHIEKFNNDILYIEVRDCADMQMFTFWMNGLLKMFYRDILDWEQGVLRS